MLVKKQQRKQTHLFMKVEIDYCAKWLAVSLLDIVDILSVMLWAIEQS